MGSETLTVPDPVPLCVDLDGTLVACDTLHRSILGLLRTSPLACAMLPVHVMRGRAAFKRAVSSRYQLAAESLPYREDVLAYLRDQRTAGRQLFLVTAADGEIGRAIADHLGLFDHVIASEGSANVKGAGKVAAIRRHLGERPFDYMGDSWADIPVFASARRSLLVYPSERTARRAAVVGRIERVFGRGEKSDSGRTATSVAS